MLTIEYSSDKADCLLLPRSCSNRRRRRFLSTRAMDNVQRKVFLGCLFVSQVFAIAMVGLAVVWTMNVLGGFAWDGTSKEFNVHPFMMTCGFILLFGEATIIFRVFRYMDKTSVKILHGIFQLLAFISIVIGLAAVFEFHNTAKIPNMYSLHSWCGLLTVLLFCIQLAFGGTFFLIPGVQQHLRAFYLPVHRYFGIAIFFLCAVTAISGINEKQFFVFGNAYSSRTYGAVIGNCFGLVTLGYIVIVGFLANNPEWKRQPDGEAEPLSVHFRQVSSHTETDED